MHSNSQVMAQVHKDLKSAFPSLRFHVKKKEVRGSRPHIVLKTALIVEYDRAGILSYDANERVLRHIVKSTLDQFDTDIERVTFEKYVPHAVAVNRVSEEICSQLESVITDSKMNVNEKILAMVTNIQESVDNVDLGDTPAQSVDLEEVFAEIKKACSEQS